MDINKKRNCFFLVLLTCALAITVGFSCLYSTALAANTNEVMKFVEEDPDAKTIYDIYIETTPGVINVLQKVSIYSVTDFVGRSFFIVSRVVGEKTEKAYIDMDRVRVIVPSTGFDFAAV